MKQRTITFVFTCLTIMTACGPNPYNIANMTVRELEVTSDSNLCLAAKSQWQTPKLMDEIAQRNLSCSVGLAQQRQFVSGKESPTINKPISNIRNIDFRNFEYPISPDDFEIFKENSVKVNNGKYESGDENAPSPQNLAWKSFTVEKPIYGDLTGDGMEEVIVPVTMSWVGANPAGSYQELFYVYKMEGEKPNLLVPPFNNFYKDYQVIENVNDRCDGWIWSRQAKEITDQLIIFELFVAGRQCDEKGFDVTMKYKFDGKQLTLSDKPVKKHATSKP